MALSDLIERLASFLPVLMAALPVTLLIVLGAFLLNLLVGRLVVLLARRTHLSDMDVLPIRKLVSWLVRLAALVLILGVFGFEIGGIWTMLSTVLGLIAIGFVAMWSLISHTTATMLILLLRPFQIGDDVEIAGEPVRGRVIDINFFFTTLIDHDGVLQQIPNNMFFQKTLKRRRNTPQVSLAAQLHSHQPAAIELPAPPPPVDAEPKDAAAAPSK